ncbi:MAG: 3'-5' exonuclease [Rhodocyclaceae bacterium]|nr:3'-5' exonuclease [Rhodocyclaceae bacterium]
MVDVETTGLDPEQDRICEVGALRLVGGREEGRYHALVRPDRPVSEDARATHGITDDMLRDAPPFGLVAPALRRFLAGSILVAQNAAFDLAFLNAEFRRAGMSALALPAIDTIALARRVRPGLPTYNLDSLARLFAVPVTDRHRSLGDCEATARIFWKCVQALDPPPRSTEDLLRRGRR